ncbi:MAG: hypothetical protein DRI32_03010 [Chloroflexi bacterium]|nr:MAG: hypothetical protein DRI32_03010 [Chloroflexota bacterium]
MTFATSLLWQNDETWANATLGFGPQTIKDWGCLATSLTMVVNGCGYNETPATVNQKMAGINAFFGAAINAYRIGEAFPAVSLKELVDCETIPAPIARIDAELEASKPVLVRVDWNAAPGLQDHWVVIYGKDAQGYMMLDPWKYAGDAPEKVLHLTERYTFSGSTPAEAITSVIFFTVSGKADAAPTPAAAATPVQKPALVEQKAVPSDALTVNPTTDGVAFRGAPSVSGPLLERFPLNTTLTSLEARTATLAKIGIQGQWLNVQSPKGVQGYVAAWYVSSDEKPAKSAPPAAEFVVKVIEANLAFRSQPVISDQTLIARLPVGTALTVIDPDASQKLGVYGQWLKVKDASGKEGYTAAWFVSK